MNLKKIVLILCINMSTAVLAEPPERMVIGDGSLTEIIYALDSEDKLAGVDTTSIYPREASALPSIGYKRNISVEGVLSLNPDVLLVTEDSGPTKNLNQLEQAGLKIQTFSSEPSMDAVKQKILGIAEILDKSEAGDLLWQQVKTKVDNATARAKKVKHPLKVLFVLNSGEKSPVIGGKNTHADSIIRMAGGINVIEDVEGYKPITNESVAIANPDVILMMEHSSLSKELLFKKPGFNLTNAAQKQRLITMDGLYILGFGPRIGDAIEELSQQLYPDLKNDQL